MGAYGNVHAFARVVGRGRAPVLIYVVNPIRVVLAFGKIEFAAKGKKSLGIDVKSELISDGEDRGWSSLGGRHKLQAITIEKLTAILNGESQRANHLVASSQKHLIVKRLANLEW